MASEVQDIYEKVLATKRSTVCIKELVQTILEEDTIDEETEDSLIKKHNIMISLLKCSGAFTKLGLQAPDARGAIAEIMCTYVLERWLETRKCNGGFVNGVMLKVYPNTEGKTETTELDVVLVTDKMICIIECKSFKGNKVTDGNILSTKNISKQPWNQNQGHVIAFKNNSKKYLQNIKLPRIYNVVYVFAEGKFTEWKQPDDKDNILLMNIGAFHMLDILYDGVSNDVGLTKKEVSEIMTFIQENEPTVEQQTQHVLRLRELL